VSNLQTSDLIRNTRQLLQGNARSPVNTLDGAKAAISDAMTVNYPIQGVQPGSTIEIGWVEYSVVDVQLATRTFTVVPEIEGTAVDHPDGARVTLRPRYPVRRIIEALNADLMDLSTQGIYKLRVIEATDGEVVVPEDAIAVLDVWNTDAERSPAANWRISDTPTGSQLLGPQTLGHVVFGCTFSEFSYTDDVDVTTTGLVSSAEDLPPMGAALRLLAGAEAQRNLIDSQGDTRRATEVPATAITGALRNLAALRQQRVIAEAARFQQRYGIKMFVGV
jgi:hypothetical protein